MLLHVFEMEQMIETQIKKHIMSCFKKDVYIKLKHLRLGYTNVTVERFIEYVYLEYGEKMEELQNRLVPYFVVPPSSRHIPNISIQ